MFNTGTPSTAFGTSTPGTPVGGFQRTGGISQFSAPQGDALAGLLDSPGGPGTDEADGGFGGKESHSNPAVYRATAAKPVGSESPMQEVTLADDSRPKLTSHGRQASGFGGESGTSRGHAQSDSKQPDHLPGPVVAAAPTPAHDTSYDEAVTPGARVGQSGPARDSTDSQEGSRGRESSSGSSPAGPAMPIAATSGVAHGLPAGSAAAMPAIVGVAALDFSDMRRFLTSPLPQSAGIVQCYIERDKKGLNKRMYPVYSLYMKAGDRFLLAAKKRPKQKTSNYVLSMDASDMARDSASYMGKVRSNFVGTEFVVYDHGEKAGTAKAGQHPRNELAVALYASNVMGSRGPRKMRVAVPRLDVVGAPAVFSGATEEDSMVEEFKAGHTQHMTTLVNKPPKWNEQVGAYVLNFNGRVTMASVKNFQLVRPEDLETLTLQFGRVGKDLFTMDFSHPLSPLQAFGICVTSFDYKLACE